MSDLVGNLEDRFSHNAAHSYPILRVAYNVRFGHGDMKRDCCLGRGEQHCCGTIVIKHLTEAELSFLIYLKHYWDEYVAK